jgi:hypothetical protein
MAKARAAPDYRQLAEVLKLAQSGRFRTTKEIENALGAKLTGLSRSERELFDDMCVTARRGYLRNGQDPKAPPR